MELPLNPRLTTFNVFSVTRLEVPAFVSRLPNDPAPSAGRRPPLRTLKLNLGSKRDLDAPLVSCLMPTRNRFHQAQIAVRVYRRQTWPNKELIIVVDGGGDEPFVEWAASLNDPSIRVIRVDENITLGELRNRSVVEAAGQYICQWDDDDMSHPARIEVQIKALKATRSKACLLARELLWFPRQARLAVTEFRAQEGTLLCEKAIMPPYPPLRRGEDTPAVAAILNAHPFVALDLPELYVRVAHGANTWDDAHMERFWRRATQRFEGDAYHRAVSQLAGACPLREYREGMIEQQRPHAA